MEAGRQDEMIASLEKLQERSVHLNVPGLFVGNLSRLRNDAIH